MGIDLEKYSVLRISKASCQVHKLTAGNLNWLDKDSDLQTLQLDDTIRLKRSVRTVVGIAVNYGVDAFINPMKENIVLQSD